MTIETIGKIGKIVSGEETSRFVKVVDDSGSTGGFLILTAEDLEFRNGFDAWVLDEAALTRYFQESGWLIEWLNT